MPSEYQRAKRLMFWHMFGASLLILTGVFIFGLAFEFMIDAIFY